MKVLIIQNCQNDFIDEYGTLYIKDSKFIIPEINKLLNSKNINLKVLTQEWHPFNHISFAKTHNAKQYTEKKVKQNGVQVNQIMWPEHCVAGEWGSQFYSDLDIKKADIIMRKGSDIKRENYSFLEYLSGGYTEYYDMIKNLKVDEFILCGVATNHHIYSTACSLISIKKPVTIIISTVKSVEGDKISLSKLEKLGCKIKDIKNYV